jgi:hypothetical protein
LFAIAIGAWPLAFGSLLRLPIFFIVAERFFFYGT